MIGACKPALVQLVKDAQSSQLVLDLEDDATKTSIAAFVDSDTFDGLHGGDRLAIRQAIQLFDFMSSKPDALLAPVFQPLLGRIDHAAENLLIARLEPLLPESAEDRRAFFEGAEGKFLAERVRSLRRLLLNRSPIMPTGLLLFALKYAKTGDADRGVLHAVRGGFAVVGDEDLESLLKRQYEFRNEYVAHEKREPLWSVEAAREALSVWVNVLVRLRKLGELSELVASAE